MKINLGKSVVDSVNNFISTRALTTCNDIDIVNCVYALAWRPVRNFIYVSIKFVDLKKECLNSIYERQ